VFIGGTSGKIAAFPSLIFQAGKMRIFISQFL
jgi:hypothetical protein